MLRCLSFSSHALKILKKDVNNSLKVVQTYLVDLCDECNDKTDSTLFLTCIYYQIMSSNILIYRYILILNDFSPQSLQSHGRYICTSCTISLSILPETELTHIIFSLMQMLHFYLFSHISAAAILQIPLLCN